MPLAWTSDLGGSVGAHRASGALSHRSLDAPPSAVPSDLRGEAADLAGKRTKNRPLRRLIVLISVLWWSAALSAQLSHAQQPPDAWWKPRSDEVRSAPKPDAEPSEEALPRRLIVEDDSGTDPSGERPADPLADRERQQPAASEEPPPSESAEEVECFRDLKSIDHGLANPLEDHRFAHVFVRSRTYPYYKHRRNAFIGLPTSRRKPHTRWRIGVFDSTWRNLEGSGNEGHASIIFDFEVPVSNWVRTRGGFELPWPRIEGIQVPLNRNNLAFFLTPEPESRAAMVYYAHALPKGLAQVATVVDGEERFLDQAFHPYNTSYFPQGRSPSAMHPGLHQLTEKLLHVVRIGRKTVTIAGEERSTLRICQEEEAILAATNSDALVDLIERYLDRRAVLVRLERAVLGLEMTVGEFRESFDDLPSKAWIPVMSIPKKHVAEHEEWNNLGRVQLVFSRDPYSSTVIVRKVGQYGESYRAWIAGEILVNGSSLDTFGLCVRAWTPSNPYHIGQFVDAQSYTGLDFGDDLDRGCRTMCEEGTCRLELRKSLVPKNALRRASETKVESMKRHQARIDVVRDFGASKAEWLDAYAGLEESVMVPLIVVDDAKPKKRSYSSDHPALGVVRLSFETSSNLRSSMTERSRSLWFRLPGRLTVNGVAFKAPSDVAAAVVELERRDDKKLYKEIKRGEIDGGQLKRLVSRKSVARIDMRNFRSPAFRVICGYSASKRCTILVSKGEIERRLGLLRRGARAELSVGANDGGAGPVGLAPTAR